MKPTHTTIRTYLVWALMLTFVGMLPQTSYGQNKKEKVVVGKKAAKGDASEETIVVEIKDGKVFVDGKEVADAEMEGKKIRVLRQGKDGAGEATIWVDGTSDGEGTYSFFSKEGNAFFGDDADGRFVFKSNDGNRVVERMLDLKELNETVADARLRSRMAPMADRMLEFKSGGDAFAVYADAMSSFGSGETLKKDMMSRELAMKIRTSEGDTSKLEAELEDLLAEIFSEKQESYQDRVDRLREELSELELKVSDRQSNKADIIAKRKKDLLGTKDKYDW